MQKKLLNIIGCGKLGKALAAAWVKNSTLEIGDILNSTFASTQTAIEFIQKGRAVTAISELSPADIFLISTPDALIAELCSELAASDILRSGDVVFHCSGALSSSFLEPAKGKGAWIASVHPVMTFATSSEFKGTYCGVEGQEEALTILKPIFESIGGIAFEINSENKTIYHAANVTASNYLVALLEQGIQLYMKAGVGREVALKIMQPLVQTTMDNVFNLGTTGALTGPIARGDFEIVAKQLTALDQINSGELYRQLGLVALELSKMQGAASQEALSRLAELLNCKE